MDLMPVTQTNDRQREFEVHLRCRNVVFLVATLGGAPQERFTPEIRDNRRTTPLERKLVTQRNLLVAELLENNIAEQ
jgi:hypothetical protein